MRSDVIVLAAVIGVAVLAIVLLTNPFGLSIGRGYVEEVMLKNGLVDRSAFTMQIDGQVIIRNEDQYRHEVEVGRVFGSEYHIIFRRDVRAGHDFKFTLPAGSYEIKLLRNE